MNLRSSVCFSRLFAQKIFASLVTAAAFTLSPVALGVSTSTPPVAAGTAQTNSNSVSQQSAALSDLVVPVGHTSSVMHLSASADGKMMVTATQDGSIYLWDVPNARELGHWSETTGLPTGLTISPDAKLFAVGHSNVVDIWDVGSGKPTHRLSGDFSMAPTGYAIAFSPDGKTLATTSYSGEMQLWDTATGTLRAHLPKQLEQVLAICFEDENDIAVAGASNSNLRSDTVLGVRLSDGKAIFRESLSSPSPTVFVSCAPKSQLIAVGSGKNSEVWNYFGEKRSTITLTDQYAVVSGIAFDRSGSTLAVSELGKIHFFTATGNKEVRTIQEGGFSYGELALSGENLLGIASFWTDQGDLMSWKFATGTPKLFPFKSATAIRSLSVPADGSLLLVSSWTGSQIWDLRAGTIQSLKSDQNPSILSEISPDGTLLTTRNGSEVDIVDRATGVRRSAAPFGDYVTFSPDSSLIAFSNSFGSTMIKNAVRMERVANFGQTPYAPKPVFSADGKMFVDFSPDPQQKPADQNQIVTDLSTGKPISFSVYVRAVSDWTTIKKLDVSAVQAWNPYDPCAQCLAFSPDSSTLYVGLGNQLFRFDTASWRPKPTIQTGGNITAFVVSKPEKAIAIAIGNSAEICDSETGKTIASWTVSDAVVDALAFGPQGDWLATGSRDGGVRIWDPHGGRLQLTTIAYRLTDDWVAFTPDGNITGSSEGVRNAFLSSPGNLLKTAPVAGSSIDSALLKKAFPAVQTAVAKKSSTEPERETLGQSRAPKTQQQRSLELVVQRGHSGDVDQLVWSSDSRWAATVGEDRVIIWDPTTATELRDLVHPEEVTAIIAVPGGKSVLTICKDRYLREWDVESGRVVRSLRFVAEPAAFALSPAGKLLAIVSSAEIAFLDPSTWKLLSPISGHWELYGRFSINFINDQQLLLGLRQLDNSTRFLLWNTTHGTSAEAVKLIADDTTGNESTAVSHDGRLAATAAGDGGHIVLWDTETWKKIRVIPESASALDFSSNDKLLLTRGDKSQAWNVETGQVSALPVSGNFSVVAFSPDGSRAAAAGKRFTVVPLPKGETAESPQAIELQDSIAFSPDGRYLGVGLGGYSGIWNLMSGDFTGAPYGLDSASAFAFSYTHPYSVNESCYFGNLQTWHFSQFRGKVLASPPGLPKDYVGGDSALTPDGHWMASVCGSKLNLFDLRANDISAKLLTDKAGDHVSFSADGNTLASWGMRGLKLWQSSDFHLLRDDSNSDIRAVDPALSRALVWTQDCAVADCLYSVAVADIATGKQTAQLALKTSLMIGPSALSRDGKIAAVATENEIGLYNAETGARTTVFSMDTNVKALVFSPVKPMLAALGTDGAVRLLDLENGGKEIATLLCFSRPLQGVDWLVTDNQGFFDGSLPALSRVAWRFEDSTFKVLPAESFLNDYYSPGLLKKLLDGKGPKATAKLADRDRRLPKVKLSIDRSAAINGSTPQPELQVKVTVTEAAATSDLKQGSGVRDVRLFRNGALVHTWHGDVPLDSSGAAALETEVPLVPGNNQLTAYAFSRSDIKSRDASLRVIGSPALARKKTAYVITIGLNTYANPQFKLNFAQADAEAFASEFARRQLAVKNYDAVNSIPLLNADATKANILAVFKRLAGAPLDSFPQEQQRLIAQAAIVGPQDGVFIYYAGHGYAYQNRFYLLPYDFKIPDADEDLAKPESNTISDLDLDTALEPVDGSRMVLVVDACQSGTVLENGERLGPMNSKGLAQLAYEKGMYIITASKGAEAALEAQFVGHGFLTYALVEEGLKTKAAAVDGEVELRHWMEYATLRVPELDIAFHTGGGKLSLPPETLDDVQEQQLNDPNLQHPRIFYRREPETTPFLVSRP